MCKRQEDFRGECDEARLDSFIKQPVLQHETKPNTLNFLKKGSKTWQRLIYLARLIK
jgi:hypothetical protein